MDKKSVNSASDISRMPSGTRRDGPCRGGDIAVNPDVSKGIGQHQIGALAFEQPAVIGH